jgi:putative transcriptional regulator
MTNRVRELRSERDWSQGALAEQLGVSRAFKIAVLFDLAIEDVFEPDEKPKRRTATTAGERSKR